jgi:hypothetical protein
MRLGGADREVLTYLVIGDILLDDHFEFDILDGMEGLQVPDFSPICENGDRGWIQRSKKKKKIKADGKLNEGACRVITRGADLAWIIPFSIFTPALPTTSI